MWKSRAFIPFLRENCTYIFLIEKCLYHFLVKMFLILLICCKIFIQKEYVVQYFGSTFPVYLVCCRQQIRFSIKFDLFILVDWFWIGSTIPRSIRMNERLEKTATSEDINIIIQTKYIFVRVRDCVVYQKFIC